MAEPFVKVDLSPAAPDFQSLALDRGIPMLDQLNSNYQILHRWLKGFVAEPVLDGKYVGFLIPYEDHDDERGGARDRTRERPISRCVPVTPKDLRKDLRKPLNELRSLISRIQPKGERQSLLYAKLSEALATDLAPANPNPGCNLFKYQDQNRRWRLLWCWGYRRRSAAPADPVVRDGVLILTGAETHGDLPAARGGAWGRIVAALVLLALIGGAGYLGQRQGWLAPWLGGHAAVRGGDGAPAASGPAMRITPERWEGPEGSRVEFVLTRRDGEGKETDVRGQAAAVVDDPRVLEIDPVTSVATARSAGKTVVRFHLGRDSVQATVSVLPPEAPSSLALVPEKLDVAVGSTARVKLIGKFKDGREADLTGSAEWSPTDARTTFCYRGLVEGLAEGDGGVRARYRPRPDAPFQDAVASFHVAPGEFKSLELGVTPSRLAVGSPGALRAEAVTIGGEKRSVLQSSLLKWEPEGPQLSVVDGTHVLASRPGKSRLRATYKDLSQTIEIEAVGSEDGPAAKPSVSPLSASLVVGEVVPLTVSPEADETTEFVSNKPAVVEVDEVGRMMARSAGQAEVVVRQGGQEIAVVALTVSEQRFRSIALVPDRIQVGVEATTTIDVVGKTEGGRDVRITPDELTWEILPSSQFVEFDIDALTVRGLAPTGGQPQILGARLRLGDLRAQGQIEVVATPFQLDVTPAGPVSIPVGQDVTLQAWSVFGDGNRVEIKSPELEWKVVGPDAEVKGLSLKRGTITATAPNSAPLTVRATYQGQTSKPVTIKSVAAEARELTLKAARPILLVGETGALSLSDGGGGSSGLARGGTFASDQPKILVVDPVSGAYRAIAPGEATVRATHPASPQPATARIRVTDPKEARLEFRPAKLALGVDAVESFELGLVTKTGRDAADEFVPLGPTAREVSRFGRTDTVRWSPPRIVGVKPCAEFPVTASYLGLSATARVSVVAPDPKESAARPLRIDPASETLAGGKTVSPKVEQQQGGKDSPWREVRADAIRWEVPPGVVWTPPTPSLRPSAALARGVAEPQTLVARYQGQSAKLTLTPGGEAPARPAFSRIAIKEEPSRGPLYAGEERRFRVVGYDAKGQEVEVPDAKWTPNFDDSYARWEAPVLTGMKSGKNPRLTATVGDRSASVMVVLMDRRPDVASAAPSTKTSTRKPVPRRTRVGGPRGLLGGYGYGYPWGDGYYGPGYVGPGYVGPRYWPWDGWGGAYRPWLNYYHPSQPVVVDGRTVRIEDLPRERVERLSREEMPAARPKRLTIATAGGGETLTIPVGVASRDFRVEAHFEGLDQPQDVTNLATVSVAGGSSVAAIRDGRIVGLEAGSTSIEASYQGLTTEPDLHVSVTGDRHLDRIALEPAALTLAVGESATLTATGFANERALGDVTDFGDLAWKSRNGDLLQVDGPTVTALAPGVAGVTVQSGSTISNVVEVTIVAGARGVTTPLSGPRNLELLVGETRHIGSDLAVTRGKADVSDQVTVSATAPEIFRYNARERSLTGLAPGTGDVVFSLGDARVTTTVRVHNTPPPKGKSKVVIEPSGDTLAVGEARALRVYLVGESGERLDRTESAQLSVSGAIARTGSTLRGLKPGTGEVKAALPGIDAPGVAAFTVRDEPVASIQVRPNPLRLAVGERRRLQITGINPTRRIEMGAHPDLTIAIDGPDASAVEVVEGDEILGRGAGKATVRVAWRGAGEVRVPVEVTGDAPSGLRFEPDVATVEVGKSVTFRVFGDRGGASVALGPDDGLEIGVSQPGVARVEPDLSIRGLAPGTAEVSARLGTQRAAARLTVTAPGEEENAAARPPHAEALLFRPETLTLTLGTGGLPISVVQALGEDQSDDVSKAATITADDPKIVEVIRTASDLVLRPVAVGETKVTASHGGLKSETPLLVRVVASAREEARLQATPRPLRIRVGDRASFLRVEVVPAPGERPVEVAYTIAADGTDLVTVEGRDTLSGKKIGRGEVTLACVDPGGKYDGLRCKAPIEVLAEDSPADAAQAVLVLSGPDRATVGEAVQFRVDRVVGGFSRPATNAGTTLVLGQDQANLAEVAPGCILTARKPGRVSVVARQGELVSGPRELTIEAAAASFRSLELSIRPEALVLTERRPFRILGHPGDGGPPQDLTALVGAAPKEGVPLVVTVSPPGEKVVGLEPPFLVAKGVGGFRLQASRGDLKSNEVELQVGTLGKVRLGIDPDAMTLHVGERTPKIRVTGASAGDPVARELATDLTSSDPRVLAPDPGAKDRFFARATGQARVTARLGDQEVAATVTVIGNPFASVKAVKTSDLAGGGFVVDVEARGTRPESGKRDYRFVAEGGGDDGWVAAQPDGDSLVARLRSPRLQYREDVAYRLVMEAREPGSKSIERYPFTFRARRGGVQIEPENGAGEPAPANR